MFVHNIFRLKFLCGRFRSEIDCLMIVLQTPKSRQYILLPTDLYFTIVQ